MEVMRGHGASNEILNLINDIFTKTHEPVGSKALRIPSIPVAPLSGTIWRLWKRQGFWKRRIRLVAVNLSVAGFQYFVKHSLSFDRLVENELYEVIKAFDHEFFSTWRTFFNRQRTF